LEFTIPQGIGINLSRSSTDEFKVTYTSKYENKIITSMGYLFTSKPLKLSPNTFIAYNQLMLERYYQQIENRLTSNHIHLENGELERLRLPLAKSDIEQDLKLSKQLEPSYVQSVLNWIHDKTLSTSDYLLYGNIFLPQGRVEGLYTCQLSSNSQCIISGVSSPKRPDQSHVI
jgi:distribution and morphology protein 10